MRSRGKISFDLLVWDVGFVRLYVHVES